MNQKKTSPNKTDHPVRKGLYKPIATDIYNAGGSSEDAWNAIHVAFPKLAPDKYTHIFQAIRRVWGPTELVGSEANLVSKLKTAKDEEQKLNFVEEEEDDYDEEDEPPKDVKNSKKKSENKTEMIEKVENQTKNTENTIENRHIALVELLQPSDNSKIKKTKVIQKIKTQLTNLSPEILALKMGKALSNIEKYKLKIKKQSQKLAQMSKHYSAHFSQISGEMELSSSDSDTSFA